MTREELATTIEALEAFLASGNDFALAETNARELLNVIKLLPEAEGFDEFYIRALIVLSKSLWQRGNAKEALPFSLEALAHAEQKQGKDLIAKALENIGIVFHFLSDLTKALESYTRALMIFEELGIKRGVANNTTLIGIVYSDLSDNAKALEFYNRALTLSEELGDRSGAASTNNNIGNLYWNLSDYAKALEYLTRAKELWEETGNMNGLAKTTTSIGIVYTNLCDYTQALEYYARSLELCGELGDNKGVATITVNMGNVYEALSDNTKALEYYTRALILFEELGDKIGEAVAADNIGTVYSSLSDSAKSLEYHNRALALAEEIGLKSRVANSLGNIGIVYRDLADYEKALEFFIKALALFEEIGDTRGVATNNARIGHVFANENYVGYDDEMALEYMLKATASFEEISAKRELYQAHKFLVVGYKKQGRIAEALNHFEKYHDLEKEVQSEEAKKHAERLDYERKTTEREKQLAVERAKHEVTLSLLNKTLPPSIAERLMDGEKNIADKFESASILFADIVGFTPLSARTEPKRIVELLNNLFTRFDKLTLDHKVERIKTIGDAYMVVSGAPEQCDNHAERVAHFALAMLKETEVFAREVHEDIALRIGISSGEVVGAVVGETKFSYDVWSDAVNTASRMESHGVAGKIHCSPNFKEEWSRATKNEKEPRQNVHDGVCFVERGQIDVKGIGRMRTFFLERGSNNEE